MPKFITGSLVLFLLVFLLVPTISAAAEARIEIAGKLVGKATVIEEIQTVSGVSTKASYFLDIETIEQFDATRLIGVGHRQVIRIEVFPWAGGVQRSLWRSMVGGPIELTASFATLTPNEDGRLRAVGR